MYAVPLPVTTKLTVVHVRILLRYTGLVNFRCWDARERSISPFYCTCDPAHIGEDVTKTTLKVFAGSCKVGWVKGLDVDISNINLSTN